MSAGMAGVIAAHPERKYGVFTEGGWWIGCTECDWQRPIGGSPIDTNTAPLHAAHVAEELAKAGYGLLHSGPEVEDYDFGDPDPVNVPGSFVRAFNPAPDPLAAALADPEGHELVKAIHDRKAEANGN